MASETIKALDQPVLRSAGGPRYASLHQCADKAPTSRDDLALATLTYTCAGQPRHDLSSDQWQALNVGHRNLELSASEGASYESARCYGFSSHHRSRERDCPRSCQTAGEPS